MTLRETLREMAILTGKVDTPRNVPETNVLRCRLRGFRSARRAPRLRFSLVVVALQLLAVLRRLQLHRRDAADARDASSGMRHRPKGLVRTSVKSRSGSSPTSIACSKMFLIFVAGN
jgi:hypothetical protein